jgi:hypothetical protein
VTKVWPGDIYEEEIPACKCAQILFLTRRGEGALKEINHVCEATMRLSCRRWAWSVVPERLPDWGVARSLPIGDGRFTEAVEPLAPRRPIPIAHSVHPVALVLRQWVEHPEEKLIRTLEEMPAWQKALRWAKLMGRFRVVECPEDRSWWDERLPEDVLGRLVAYLFCLQNEGLPATPGTAEYLFFRVTADDYQQHFPHRPACPTRGILVTSLALVPDFDAGMDHGDMTWSLFPSAQWTNDALRVKATRVAHSHWEWWKTIPLAGLPKGDLRRYNRRQSDELSALIEQCVSGRLDERTLVQEALQQEHQRLGRATNPKEKKAVIRKIKARTRRKKPSR